HQQISKRRLRLRNIDPNEELFKVYQLERSQERKTEALTSWANHPDSLRNHLRVRWQSLVRETDEDRVVLDQQVANDQVAVLGFKNHFLLETIEHVNACHF
ncbi:MAG: hypothetical protein O7C75_02315, partial [Verrucomicrobia bacterium]|nr:hypothetical protein [Verrucomicrobiota bacterium]